VFGLEVYYSYLNSFVFYFEPERYLTEISFLIKFLKFGAVELITSLYSPEDCLVKLPKIYNFFGLIDLISGSLSVLLSIKFPLLTLLLKLGLFPLLKLLF